tara:strand:- start:889 stop:1092 length:204 start_codon:yes stop_codon:yes gene_type:complete
MTQLQEEFFALYTAIPTLSIHDSTRAWSIRQRLERYADLVAGHGRVTELEVNTLRRLIANLNEALKS